MSTRNANSVRSSSSSEKQSNAPDIKVTGLSSSERIQLNLGDKLYIITKMSQAVESVRRNFQKFRNMRGSGVVMKWFPFGAHSSLVRFGIIGCIAFCWGIDWQLVMDKVPYYNQKFKEMEQEES